MAEWWEEAFRADYLRVYPHRDDKEAALDLKAVRMRLPCLDAGRRVLDLACGAGRHLRAMEAQGMRAIGADLSPDLLEEARRRGARNLVRCDMRKLPFRDAAFDAVTMWFNSFGYFSTDEEDASVLREASRVLLPDGGLVLELMDARELRRNLVPRSETTKGEVEVLEERSLADDGRRVRKQVTLRRGTTVRTWTESVRLYSEDEVRRMAEQVGMKLREFGREEGDDVWRLGRVPRMVLSFVKAAA